MLWIMGADTIGHAALGVAAGPVSHALAEQLDHVPWAGFRFYDLIFPLFVFIIGVSLVFSLTKAAAGHGKDAAIVRLFRRSVLLYLLGIFYYGGFSTPLADIRLLGVLQRLALCYFAAGALFLFCRTRTLVIVAVAALLGYWALLTQVPIRDISVQKDALNAAMSAAGSTNAMEFFLATTNTVRGGYEEGRNLVNHFDFRFLPLKKWDGNYDPEGILSTIPAVVSCLLGVFAGLLLRDERRTPLHKAALLAGAGVALLAAGYGWGFVLPVIKKLWTPSYVLVAGGWSALLLAAFYYVIDIRGWQAWARPFLWIGMNAITVYLAGNLLNFDQLASRLAGGNVRQALDGWVRPGFGDFVIAVIGIGLGVWLARALYRRKIFLRI